MDKAHESRDLADILAAPVTVADVGNDTSVTAAQALVNLTD